MERIVNFSIVIPSYNTKKLLRDCLQSIQDNPAEESKFEIVVVDNASTDGSQEMVADEFRDVHLIKNRKNKGFASAVNQGWRVAKGEFILFLNSDTVVKKNSLDIVVDYAKTNPDVGAISGKPVLRNGQLDPDSHRGFPTPWSALTFFLGLEKLFPKSRLFAQYHQGWKDKNKIHEIDAGAGVFLLVRKSVLEKIGGWDESYFFYGEDIDLCFRIKKAGYKIVFHPKAEVMHYKGASSGLRRESRDVARPTRKELMKVTRGSIDAWKVFYRKFYKDKYPFWLTGLVLFGIEVKGILRTLMNMIRPLSKD